MSTLRNNEVATFLIVCKSIDGDGIKQNVIDGCSGCLEGGVPLYYLNFVVTAPFFDMSQS